MLFQAGMKDGAKIMIVELTAYREQQAELQAAQEQEAALQRQQAAAVQQVVFRFFQPALIHHRRTPSPHFSGNLAVGITCKVKLIAWYKSSLQAVLCVV